MFLIAIDAKQNSTKINEFAAEKTILFNLNQLRVEKVPLQKKKNKNLVHHEFSHTIENNNRHNPCYQSDTSTLRRKSSAAAAASKQEVVYFRSV